MPEDGKTFANWKKLLLLTLAALGSAAVYWRRRSLLARWLALPPPRFPVGVERGLHVPAFDGIALAADHYYPAAGAQVTAFPTILIRTPYGRRLTSPFYARRFAERGYHVLVQDVRGCFGSEGDFEPFVHEADDGVATVRWLEEQVWFDGRLGTWGQSYPGYVQWALAAREPAAVQAVVPAITSSQGFFTALTEGAPMLDLPLRWMVLLDALDNPRRVMRLLLPSGLDRAVAPAAGHLPLKEADVIAVGSEVPFYREALRERRRRELVDTDYSGRLEQVTAPVHLVGGWYDFMLGDLLSDYATLAAAGRQPYLTIGPWIHLDRQVSRSALREGLSWFEAHLKDQPDQVRRRPVRVFLMGADEWRELDAWPPEGNRSFGLYPQEHGQLSDRFPPNHALPDHYLYDPADPTPALGGPLFRPDAGPKDNGPLEARPDVLTFTGPPLIRDVDVIGPVRLELFVRSSLDHADFFGRLCDVYPDGRSINVCEGIYRLQPGKGERLEDGSVRLEIDMWGTAYRFKLGHRIRLQVSSGAHPHYARNLGTGESLATATEMQAAYQTIYHDAYHPSVLRLPLGRVSGGRLRGPRFLV